MPEYTTRRIEDLHLDPRNPRLPIDKQDQDEWMLLKYIAQTYNAIELGRSIATYGYFLSEPLIVINQEGKWIVVEGNRRLTALCLLHAPKLAAELDLENAAEWHQLADSVSRQNNVPFDGLPVVVADNREQVAPIIGYRHISGIQAWQPHAKARYIADLVDHLPTGDRSIRKVAAIVGERPAEVGSHYRNHEILKQARDVFNFDTTRAQAGFGVFTRAMSSLPLRRYIGAPAPTHVEVGERPIPKDKEEELEELLSWLFGDGKNAKPVIKESRDLTKLGRVLDSEHGIRALRETRNLDLAAEAAGGPRERLASRLRQAKTALHGIRSDLDACMEDDEIQSLVMEVREAVAQLVDTRS